MNGLTDDGCGLQVYVLYSYYLPIDLIARVFFNILI